MTEVIKHLGSGENENHQILNEIWSFFKEKNSNFELNDVKDVSSFATEARQNCISYEDTLDFVLPKSKCNLQELKDGLDRGYKDEGNFVSSCSVRPVGAMR